MKLYISYAQAVEIIRRNFANTPLATEASGEIVIGRKPKGKVISQTRILTPVWPTFWNVLARSNHLTKQGIEFIKHETTRPGGMDNKIGIIKELRALTGFGLKESKDAVENWPKFLATAIALDRWPDVRYGRNYGDPDYIQFV